MNLVYSIVGSIASSLSGNFRATNDIDIVVVLTSADVSEVVRVLEDDFYVDGDQIWAAIESKSSFNVIYLPTLTKADMFVSDGTSFARSELARRVPQTLWENADPVYFASAEDIILQKLRRYRLTGERSDRQWNDVQGVLKAQGPNLDTEYMRHWATQIGVSDLLTLAMDDAGTI